MIERLKKLFRRFMISNELKKCERHSDVSHSQMAAKEIVQLLTMLFCFGILFVTKTVINKVSDSYLTREDKKVGHLAGQDTLFILKDRVKKYALFI